MLMNNFKLKAITKAMGYKEEFEIIGESPDPDGYPATYYRIKTAHAGFPIYFRLMVLKNENTESIKGQLKEQLKYKIEELEQISKKNFTLSHINYVERQCCDIFGDSYEAVERKSPNYSWSMVKKKLLQIKSKKGNNFKIMYEEFIETFDIKKKQ